MNDKELLKLAAKAAGIGLKFSADESVSPRLEKTWTSWNPLTDDGDALRLAVKLDMQVEYLEFSGYARARSRMHHNEEWCQEYCMSDMGIKDPYAATRRAIVRVAAEIGKSMP